MTLEFRCLCCGALNPVTVTLPRAQADLDAAQRLSRDAFRYERDVEFTLPGSTDLPTVTALGVGVHWHAR